MTPLPARYRDTVDHCTRCAGRPTVPPTDLGSDPDGRNVVLIYTCTTGHSWTRTFTRSDLKHQPAKAGAARRQHLATTTATTAGTTAPTTTTTTNDYSDEVITARTGTARQPSPATGWNPERRTWQAR